MNFSKNPLVVFITVGFLCVFIFIFSPRMVIKPVLTPIYNISTSFNIWFLGIKNAAVLKSNNLTLQEQLSEIESIKQENKELKETLLFVQDENNIKTASTSNTVSAKVIRMLQSYQANVLLIDRGTNDGLMPGNIVGSYGSFVGEVSEVYAHTALVRVAIYEDRKYAVNLPQDMQAVVQGTYDGNHFFITTIPQAFEMQKRIFITLAQTQSFPHRTPLIIGEIQKIIPIPEEPFQSGEVIPLLPTTDIRHVMVYL